MGLSDNYTIGNVVVTKTEEQYDGDPRGLLWIWEKPNPRATYVMAIDPTVGRTGWSRSTRTNDDVRTDNGAIEMLRVGMNGAPDVQVAEYAAPIDAEDLGVVANGLGRLYSGTEEMALTIIEMYPGPGLLTFRMMVSLGYSNFAPWKKLDSLGTNNNGFGFYASPNSVKYLWLRGSRHIHNKKFEPKSEFLLEEMRACAINRNQWGEAGGTKHDDRVRAIMLGFWAIHDWSSPVETVAPKVITGNGGVANWQASDISADKLADAWEERFNEIMEAA